MLSIASRVNAKKQHVLWPIRAPTLRLRQSERHIPAAPIRTRELSSNLRGQKRILRHFGASRLHTHAPRLYFSNIIFCPHYCVFDQRAILFLRSTTSHFIGESARIPSENLLKCQTMPMVYHVDYCTQCQKGTRQLSFKSTRLVPSDIWRKRDVIPQPLYPYGKRGHQALVAASSSGESGRSRVLFVHGRNYGKQSIHYRFRC